MKKGGCLKKVIIAVIALFAILLIIGILTSDDDSAKESSSSKGATPTVKVVPTEKASKDKKSSSPKDTSKSDEKKSNEKSIDITALEFYSTLQDNEMIPYKLNSKAKKFLADHNDLFPTKKEIDDGLFDADLDYKHISKNESLYGNKMMILPTATVVQIQEEDLGNSVILTDINMVDNDGHQYYVLYRGTLKDIFEDDVVEVFGLPLGNSSFTNTDGGETLVVVIAGANVTKQEGLGE